MIAVARIALIGWLAACSTASCADDAGKASAVPEFIEQMQVTRHEAADDLLSAGLGLAGLRSLVPPAPRDPAQATAAELRRIAIWNNWRGIADLSPTGSFAAEFGSLPNIEGREYSAFARVAGARHGHRVLLQVPDGFDHKKRCLLVAPASGSRGVYGAIAVAAPWGLPRGCAIAYTDKGAGTGYFDHASDTGVRLDGTRAPRGSGLEFEPAPLASEQALVAMKHAHSGDLPEQDWGRHVLQAAEFGLAMLGEAFPEQAPFTADNTHVIAVAVSNGAAAVLRAAELDRGSMLSAAVAAAANVTMPEQASLYEYASLAGLLQPCLLADESFRASVPMGSNPALAAAAQRRCAALTEHGLLDGDTLQAQSADARARLLALGIPAPALEGAAVNVTLDLWRAVGATYASSYLRRDAGNMPCGYRIGFRGTEGKPSPASASERALWWATGSGIAPSGNVLLLDPPGSAEDPALAGLLCLHQLYAQDSDEGRALRESVNALRLSGKVGDLPMLVIHGMEDALIPEALSSGPWVQAARGQGASNVVYWQIGRAQHFDAFLGMPDFAARYVPLLPHVWSALEHTLEHLQSGTPLPERPVTQ